jgi:hypothetical protein
LNQSSPSARNLTRGAGASRLVHIHREKLEQLQRRVAGVFVAMTAYCQWGADEKFVPAAFGAEIVTGDTSLPAPHEYGVRAAFLTFVERSRGRISSFINLISASAFLN